MTAIVAGLRLDGLLKLFQAAVERHGKVSVLRFGFGLLNVNGIE
jgi:hypothetical protein